MKTITVFTPAFNRAHTIWRTYDSLCRQTSKDFEWLVVDDGSSDNTKDLVNRWIADNIIPIRYIYQENQGMHGAHNTALENINTELNVCIDSDDWMPDDAIETIVNFWGKIKDKNYAGIIGLDVTNDGTIIGTEFPDGLIESTLSDFYNKGGQGDKKVVLSTSIARNYPKYPRFDGEKYFSLGYKFHLIDKDYKFAIINKPLAIVDYQPDGSSMNMWRQYWNNPQGFMFLRKEYMRLYRSPSIRIRSCIHYISHCIRAKKKNEFFNNPCPLLSFFCVPFGIILYFQTKKKVHQKKKMVIR